MTPAQTAPPRDASRTPDALTGWSGDAVLDEPVRALRRVLERLTTGDFAMTADRIDGIVSHVIGVAQQALDAGRERLAESLDRLADVHGVSESAAIIDQFNAVQKRMNHALREIGDVLSQARAPHDLMRLRPRLDLAALGVEQASENLRALTAVADDPRLTNVSLCAAPSVGAVSALQAIEGAADALGGWFDGPDTALLRAALAHLETARAQVVAMLAQASAP